MSKSETPPTRRIEKLHVNIFHCFVYLLLYIFIPFLLISLICFAIFKQLVNLFLKLKYGPIYGGMLDSADAVWAPDFVSKPVVNVLAIIDIKSKSPDEFLTDMRKTIDEKVFNCSDDFLKLTSQRSTTLGYSYLLKNRVQVNDCVTSIDVNNNECDKVSYSSLQKIFGELSNRALPRSNTVLWEMLIVSKPVEWFNDSEKSKNYCMVVSRFNHIVGDGLSLIHFLSHIFPTDNISYSLYLKNLKIQNTSTNFLTTLKEYLNYFYIILVGPAIMTKQNFLKTEDKSILHGPELTGENIMVYSSEKSQSLLSTVKKIKSTIPGITFTDVILTGISASMESFFKSKSAEIPQYTTVALTSLIRIPTYHENVMLKNQFSIALLDLPVLSESNSMLQKLLSVKTQRNVLKKSSEYQVNLMFLSYISGLIPEPLLKMLLKIDKMTLAVSNVTAISKLTILNGCDVEDMIFFVPLRGKAGLGFSFLTYDSRFQLGLAVDKAILSSRNDAQALVDGIVEKIEALYKEIVGTSFPTKVEREKNITELCR